MSNCPKPPQQPPACGGFSLRYGGSPQRGAGAASFRSSPHGSRCFKASRLLQAGKKGSLVPRSVFCQLQAALLRLQATAAYAPPALLAASHLPTLRLAPLPPLSPLLPPLSVFLPPLSVLCPRSSGKVLSCGQKSLRWGLKWLRGGSRSPPLCPRL